MNMERYFREYSSRRQMTRQTTAPPFYRNQASHPVDNRLAITGNTNNKTPRTQNIRPRMNNFTKFENRPLSERTQTKCPKCNQLGHLPNQCQNFRIPPQRKAPPEINHFQEQSEEIPKLLKLTSNKDNFFQLTKTYLGPYDETVWLQKISNILKTNRKIGIGDNNLNAQNKAHIKRFLLFFNDQRDDIEFAYEPIQSLSEEEIEQVLKENHDLVGHPGIQKTYDRIRGKYDIPHLIDRIKGRIGTCATCQTSKTTRIRGKEEPQITDTPLESNDKIAMDVIGPLKKTKIGNQYILSIHDELTKYLILVPLKTQQTQSIWNALLNHYIYIFSAPKRILTDRGQSFISELMQRYEEAFKIKHIKTTSFHPQSNGSLERTHTVISDMLKAIQNDNETEWDQNLNFVCLAYNTMVHDATGYTPFELTFGHKANLPSTISQNPQRTYADEVSFRKREWDAKLLKARETLMKSKQRYQRDQRKKFSTNPMISCP